MEGCDDKVENNRDDGDYGCREPNWEIKFGDIVDEEWGIKLIPKEKSNNWMKTYEEGLSKNRGWMLLISCSCFTILTIDLIVLSIKIVS